MNPFAFYFLRFQARTLVTYHQPPLLATAGVRNQVPLVLKHPTNSAGHVIFPRPRRSAGGGISHHGGAAKRPERGAAPRGSGRLQVCSPRFSVLPLAEPAERPRMRWFALYSWVACWGDRMGKVRRKNMSKAASRWQREAPRQPSAPPQLLPIDRTRGVNTTCVRSPCAGVTAEE